MVQGFVLEKSRGVDMKLSEWNMNPAVKEKIVWTCGGAVFALLLALIVGGVYTITPPSGPVGRRSLQDESLHRQSVAD
jgi:hypothetical protein